MLRLKYQSETDYVKSEINLGSKHFGTQQKRIQRNWVNKCVSTHTFDQGVMIFGYGGAGESLMLKSFLTSK